MKAHGWKIALYSLLILQFLAIGLFVAETFFGFRKFSAFVPPLGLAVVVFLGLLLWCVESVHARPEGTRFALRSILAACLVWGVVLFLLPFRGSDFSGKSREDVVRAFQELVAEGKVPAPVPPDGFSMDSSRGRFFSFHYLDASGRNQTYVVSLKSERFWSFQNPADQTEIRKPTDDR